jgi:hypothetical protein
MLNVKIFTLSASVRIRIGIGRIRRIRIIPADPDCYKFKHMYL